LEESIVIVGAGEAGVGAAFAVREAGFSGPLHLISQEDELPYERPSLSKEALTEGKAPSRLREARWYAEQNVKLFLGCEAVDVDPNRQTLRIGVAGQRDRDICYDRLLIATGASLRRLPFEPVRYLRTAEDGRSLHAQLREARRVAVIGGGVIGLEVASSARTLGCDVTVVEAGSSLMARALAPGVRDWLLDLHLKAGVRVLFGTSVEDIRKEDHGVSVALGSGERITADLVVGGVGISPNMQLAERAGCAVEDGVTVDANGRTSVSNIFAAGDVACFHHPDLGRYMRLQSWQHAGRHGAHVGRAMAGASGRYAPVPWFWTDQHGANIQVAGLAAEAERTIWRDRGTRATALHFTGDALVAVTTSNNGRDMRSATRLIEARWRGDAALLSDSSAPFATLAAAQLQRMSKAFVTVES
jgi:3-phenylpropionate/trans-cinnamate dioxygenase ferredoxin reductase subunit